MWVERSGRLGMHSGSPQRRLEGTTLFLLSLSFCPLHCPRPHPHGTSWSQSSSLLKLALACPRPVEKAAAQGQLPRLPSDNSSQEKNVKGAACVFWALLHRVALFGPTLEGSE